MTTTRTQDAGPAATAPATPEPPRRSGRPSCRPTRRSGPGPGPVRLLPWRIVRYRAPRWWQEIAMIAIAYWLYGVVRNAIPRHDSIALRHGRAVQHLQESLRLDFELSFNRWVAAHEPIAQAMDYYYATLHFVLTIGVLVWLYRTRPRIYRGVRTVLFTLTLFALVGFAAFPLAPPRLLPQYGYVDTLIRFHTWGSLADPKIAERSNQYAAMPSLHIAWALWCGIALVIAARRTWVRVLGVVYPIGTFLVIVGTANHFVLDAVGGAVVVVAAFVVQRVLSGHGAFVPAPEDTVGAADDQRLPAGAVGSAA